MSRRSLLGGVAGVGSASLLAACAGTPAAPEPAPASSDPAPAEVRVVALSTGHLDHCLALGVVPVGLAVAISGSTDSRGVPKFLVETFGDKYDLDAIQIVGERINPDLEKVAQLKPDLILSNKRAEAKLLESLKQVAPVVLTNGGSDVFKADLGTVGGALGRQAQAAQVLADYEKRASDWKAARGTSGTVSLVRSRRGQFLYFGTLALASQVAIDAGFTRPENQQFSDKPSRELSVEQTAMLAADWLFYAFPQGEEDLTKTKLWDQLAPVAQGRAFEVDVDPWFLNASVVAADRVLTDMQNFIK